MMKKVARMNKICFYDTKPYDKVYFDMYKKDFGFEIDYFETKLNSSTAVLSKGYEAAVAFVNDSIDAKTIDILYNNGIRIIAMRCAGYNNVDFKAAYNKIHIVRVPAYSPYAVAEHAIALLLTVNRKIHRAYNRTREYNFSLSGLTGFDLHGKTIGVIGTGKIGRVLIDICKGFGMEVIAFDPFPVSDPGIHYVPLEELFHKSDIISLHCPLTKDTQYIINKDSINHMKKGVVIINTSRGALIDSEDLLEAIKEEQVGAAGLDVYEEETDYFYEDLSYSVIRDDTLSALISMPNVIVTSHQAFLTKEALNNIASVSLQNLKEFFDDKPLVNEVCYQCTKKDSCDKSKIQRCF
jgi:D-lactate dehydrogenase